jgi:hypothetical protein
VATPTPCAEPTEAVGCLATIAGGGEGLVEGAPATASSLSEPSSVAVDGAGNLYIANAGIFVGGPAANRVLKVDPQGLLTAFAGTGEVGFSGDVGPATAARLRNPVWVAADGVGNVYIADVNNYRIRKVDRGGVITTFAGTGTPGFSGDGGPATEAEIFAGGPDGPCLVPGGMGFDAEGNLYVADVGAVRRIDPAGTITTVAGTGSPGTSGDGGPATEAEICASDVALDRQGNLYISGGGDVIRRVGPDGVIATVAGGGNKGQGDGIPAAEALLLLAWGLAVDSRGNLFFAEHRDNRIRRIGLDGIITTVAGIFNISSQGRGLFNGESGLATEIHLNEPVSVFIDAHDVLYITDTFNARIRAVHFAAAP